LEKIGMIAFIENSCW